MIIYNGKIITGLTGKWVIPNHAFDISYSTVPNGSISGPSTAYGGDTVTVTSTPGSGYLLDYITVNGVAIQGNTFTMPYGNVTVGAQFKINYNPLNLPPYTIRLETESSFTPSHPLYKFDSYTVVSITPEGHRIVDMVYNNNDWSDMLYDPAFDNEILKVLGANTTGVTNMKRLFGNQHALSEVPLFDTSSVTTMEGMFMGNISLTSVPLYDTHNVTNMSSMFYISADASFRYGLRSCPNFNTSNVTNMYMMFYGCSQLSTAPALDTSKVTNFNAMYLNSGITKVPMYTLHTGVTIDLNNMYYGCSNVTSGAYEFYNYAKNFDTSHSLTFYNCGASNNIPYAWKS